MSEKWFDTFASGLKIQFFLWRSFLVSCLSTVVYIVSFLFKKDIDRIFNQSSTSTGVNDTQAVPSVASWNHINDVKIVPVVSG